MEAVCKMYTNYKWHVSHRQVSPPIVKLNQLMKLIKPKIKINFGIDNYNSMFSNLVSSYE